MHRLFRHVQFLVAVHAMSKRRLFRAADLEAILLQPLKSDMSSQCKVISTNRNSRKGGKGFASGKREKVLPRLPRSRLPLVLPRFHKWFSLFFHQNQTVQARV